MKYNGLWEAYKEAEQMFCLRKEKSMEYYAKSGKKILSQGEIDKVRNELENLIINLENEFTETDLKVIKNNIAHLQDTKEEEQKTLKEHQDDIVKCAEMFFLEYGEYFTEKEKCLVTEACRIHDWGKANLIFQGLVNSNLTKKMYPDIKRDTQIPHGFLSAVTISKKEFKRLSELFSEEDFGPFITAVYHHHDRDDCYEGPDIRKYAEKYYLKQIKEYLGKDIDKLYCSNLNKLLYRNNICTPKFTVDSKIWNEYLLIKGLLNKFDYTVSAGYEKAEIAPDLREKKLKKNIEVYLQNKELRPAQKFMMEHKNENLVIVAPTGSGKTEAALLWLNGEKGFYTLPLKVSSNAIYSRIKTNYSYSDVALLHSDSMAMYLKEFEQDDTDIDEKYNRAKMLSQPLTVCTVDQLFKFVYKALGTEILAATLKYSKLILDEIQAYEPRVIATIIYGLKTIQEMGGYFAIITATFPPVLKKFMEKYGLSEGMQYQFKDFTEKEYQLDQFPRHKIQIEKSEINIERILEQGSTKKVLVICNTVSKAQKIYKEMQERTENVELLHSCYIRRDRAFLEEKIMLFSESEKPGIWITTQIVEASLDIDFDILYTEMCTADSLLQRMGRCNRKGRYVPEEPNIVVYDNRNGVGKDRVYDSDMYDRSLRFLHEYENILFGEELKTVYMNNVYNPEEITETSYYKEIEEWLKRFSTIHPAEYTSKEAKVRDIKSITIVPEEIYDKKQELFEYGIDFLRKPNLRKEVRSIIKNRLEDVTLSMSIYNKFPKGVDRDVIGSKNGRNIMDIHRARYKYDFDSENGKGAGLLLNEELEMDGIFM